MNTDKDIHISFNIKFRVENQEELNNILNNEVLKSYYRYHLEQKDIYYIISNNNNNDKLKLVQEIQEIQETQEKIKLVEETNYYSKCIPYITNTNNNDNDYSKYIPYISNIRPSTEFPRCDIMTEKNPIELTFKFSDIVNMKPSHELTKYDNKNRVKNRSYFLRYKDLSTNLNLAELNIGKISNYFVYSLDKPKNNFNDVFKDILIEETIIRKKRIVFEYKDAYIYLDTVENLGYFIKIIISYSINNIVDIFNEIMIIMNLKNKEVINYGYRELSLKYQSNKDLQYYVNQNKVFWVLSDDINNDLKRKQIVPCIFVEHTNDEKYLILQFDESIKFDGFKYTAWRKLIGIHYNIWVDVLLISNNILVTLDGKTVDFSELGRSTVVVDKKYLAKFSVNEN